MEVGLINFSEGPYYNNRNVRREGSIKGGLQVDWKLLVLKWRTMLNEPGSFWVVLPSFLLYQWWEFCFSSSSLRSEI